MDLSLFVSFAKSIVFGSSGILTTDLTRCKAYLWIYLAKSKFADPMGSKLVTDLAKSKLVVKI